MTHQDKVVEKGTWPMPSTPPGTMTRNLTAADVQLLSLLADGLPLAAIAHRMHLSERSVRRRSRFICDQLGVGAPIEAVVWAAKHGLI